MSYAETLQYLYQSLPMYQREGAAAYKADLSTSRALDLFDGTPHINYPTVHVAGTNGKGGVAHMLAAMLMQAGLKVALFTSPHLVDFRERIRINGQMVPKEYVVQYVESHREVFEELRPSFFEMTAAMAFSYFAEQEVDAAVIEVGMGGRLDSTNVIQPELSIITNISYDHTEFLGASLEEIANEKCGIIKEATPVIFGQAVKEVRSTLVDNARRLRVPFRFADEQYDYLEGSLSAAGQHLRYRKRQDDSTVEVVTDLLGEYQRWNVATALTALEYLRPRGRTLTWEQALEGLKHAGAVTGLQGRWQVLNTSPFIVADTGHNPDALRQTMAQFTARPHTKMRLVMGFAKEKDLGKILPLLPKEGEYYFAAADIPRALPVEQLVAKATEFGLNGKGYKTVAEAVEQAQKQAGAEDAIYVGGSTYLVAEALPLFKK